MTRVRGFTLLEVMIALALLGLALVVAMRTTGLYARSTADAQLIGVTTDLARAKMYDIEEQLRKDGFQEIEQDGKGDFAAEGHPDITWEWKAIIVELPSIDRLQALTKAQAAEGKVAEEQRTKALAEKLAASPIQANKPDKNKCDDTPPTFADSALGGMLGMIGFDPGDPSSSGNGDGAAAAKADSFITSQFQLFQQLLKASMRKVVLTVAWEVMGQKRDMKVVTYLTDPVGMTKVMGELGTSMMGGTP